MSKQFVRPADFIEPLNINGLEGRMLYVPGQAKNPKNELLVLYDLHSNIEQWWGLVVALRRYGNVTMVDLPGFGGMDSFFKINSKPTIENLADYLAAVVKLRFKRRRLTIIAVGFSFSVATRMLQKHADIRNKTNIIVSINGYAHHDDFKIDPKIVNRKAYGYGLLASKPLSLSLNLALNNKYVLRHKYQPKDRPAKTKSKAMDTDFVARFKMDLDKENDLRTRYFVEKELLRLDNCDKRINVKLWHTHIGQNSQINHRLVEQHLKVIFENYNYVPSKGLRELPFILNEERQAVKLLPAKLRRELKKLSTKA